MEQIKDFWDRNRRKYIGITMGVIGG